MGCDGGTIPKRDELVRKKKNAEKCEKTVENAAKWNYCHLSQQLLQEPIVADFLGYIYNKDSLIEAILERNGVPVYIKNLKDVKQLNLTKNPGFISGETSSVASSNTVSHWICPITGIEMNGTYKFYFISTCGCVISERAFKSVQRQQNGDDKETSEGEKCLKCDKLYNRAIDLIILNPSDDDLVLNKEKFNLRKENKTKIVMDGDVSKESKTKKSESTTKKRSLVADVATNASTSGSNDAKKKQKSAIQSDPNTSDVYKNLFNTCEKAKNQTKAHWVTFNPQYF